MPEPITHGTTIAGTAAAVLAFVFDVPPPVVFAAFAGSCFAVAMAESVSYLAAVLMLLGGTVASSYFTPYFADGYPARGVAALMAFVLIHFRTEVLQALKGRIKSSGGGK